LFRQLSSTLDRLQFCGKRKAYRLALLNKSIFQHEGGRSGVIRGEFTCRRTDAVQTEPEPPSQDRKSAYKVTNWAEYNKALRQPGDITI
jgi:hypothetical protein